MDWHRSGLSGFRREFVHVSLDRTEAGQNGVVPLVFGVRRRNYLLKLLPHRRDLVLNRPDRVLDTACVFAGIPGQVSDILRYNGEPFSKISSARRLDGTIDR